MPSTRTMNVNSSAQDAVSPLFAWCINEVKFVPIPVVLNSSLFNRKIHPYSKNI